MTAGARVAAFGALLVAIFAAAVIAGSAAGPITRDDAPGHADASTHDAAPAGAGAPGAWTVTLTLPDAGVYHAFADFQSDGRRHALGVDLFAAGSFTPLPLPPASTVRG